MYSLFTILFLILIRSWTRSKEPNQDLTKATKKIGKKLSSTGHDAEKDLSDLTEGMKSANYLKDVKESAEAIDSQFYGELFLAGIMSGMVIKFGWQ
jgi:hypothetical protein